MWLLARTLRCMRVCGTNTRPAPWAVSYYASTYATFFFSFFLAAATARGRRLPLSSPSTARVLLCAMRTTFHAGRQFSFTIRVCVCLLQQALGRSAALNMCMEWDDAEPCMSHVITRISLWKIGIAWTGIRGDALDVKIQFVCIALVKSATKFPRPVVL